MSDFQCLKDTVVDEKIPFHARQLLLFHMMQMILYSSSGVLGDVLESRVYAPVEMMETHWNDDPYQSAWQNLLLLKWLEEALPGLDTPPTEGITLPYDLWETVVNSMTRNFAPGGAKYGNVLGAINHLNDVKRIEGQASLRYFKLFRRIAQNTAMPEPARAGAKKLMTEVINKEYKPVLAYVAQIAMESVGVLP